MVGLTAFFLEYSKAVDYSEIIVSLNCLGDLSFPKFI